jgi:hypothetical protein
MLFMNKYTDEQKKIIYQKKWQREKELREHMTEEQRAESLRKHNIYVKNWYINLSEEDRFDYEERQRNKRVKQWAEMTDEEKMAEIIRQRIRRKNFSFEQLEYERERGRTHALKNKLKVLTHYSNGDIHCMNPRCEVPGGARNIWSLSIDHIDGGGRKHTEELHKDGLNFYTWLIKNNYPKGFQVLCMNCNTIKKVENKEDYKTRQPRRNIAEERKVKELKSIEENKA